MPGESITRASEAGSVGGRRLRRGLGGAGGQSSCTSWCLFRGPTQYETAKLPYDFALHPRRVVAMQQRFAARVSGLASGLALAVRPAGLAEVSGAQGWVLKIVSAKRLETIFGCP